MLYLAEPRPVPRIWGSRRNGTGEPVGELWWIWHDTEGSSRLHAAGAGGEDATTLDALVDSHGVPFAGRYPILIKTLHTADRLSLQVHPGADGGTLRKEETWIVLLAGPGAWMMAGLPAGIGPEDLAGLTPTRAESLLNRIPLTDGDAWHIPPGTVHALGPGLDVLEVQDNCDVTYRLYDWARTGPDGAPRRLHLEEGLAAAVHGEEGLPNRIGEGGRILPGTVTGCSYRLVDVPSPRTVLLSAGEALFLASGRIRAEGEVRDAPACLIAGEGGGRVEIVAGVGYRVTPGGGC